MQKKNAAAVPVKPLSVCQNCGKKFTDDKLEEISHSFWERVRAGEICPSGECPSCGSVCSPEENALTPYRAVLRKLLDTVQSTGGLVMYPDTTVAPAGDPDWIDLGDVVQAARGLLGPGVPMKMRMRKGGA
jgi:hypothetical protein